MLPQTSLPPPRYPVSPISIFFFPNHRRLRNLEPLARICASFIQELFDRGADTDSFFPYDTFLPLPFLITYALSRSPLDTSVAFGALNLLYRYKSRISLRHIKLRDPSRLFIAAYLVAAKSLSDIAFDMGTWTSLAQNNYDTHELIAMEREFCAALDWDLRVNAEVLDSFRIVTKVFLADTPSFDSNSIRSALQEEHPSSKTLELGHPPHSEVIPSPLNSPTLSGFDDWVDIQEEMARSRTSLTQSELVELEDKFKSLFEGIWTSPSPADCKATKPSMRRRCSEVFRSWKLGGFRKRHSRCSGTS